MPFVSDTPFKSGSGLRRFGGGGGTIPTTDRHQADTKLPRMAITSRILAQRGKQQAEKLGIDPHRVPPGQYLTERFPVLTVGPNPKFDLSTWDLRIFGEVENELELTWDELMALPQPRDRARHPLRHALVEARHVLARRRRHRPARSRAREAERHARDGLLGRRLHH